MNRQQFGFNVTKVGAAFLLTLAFAARAWAAPLTSAEAVARARNWMQGHPVMDVAAARAIETVTAFPAETPPECVYVVAFAQGGYLVLNADDRLPPAVAFSATSTVNLEDTPENAFRAMVSHYVAELPATLAATPDTPFKPPSLMPKSITQYGPYTVTAWNQGYPYNLYCPPILPPPTPPLNSNQGRIPVGCVPVAWAQMMSYHNWPEYGQGTHVYAGSSILPPGTETVDFSEPINWGNMLNSYNPFNLNPQQGDEDVAALMYKLGIVANATYAVGGTAASTRMLGIRVRDHLYYEWFTYHDSADSDFYTAVINELAAGFPCVVSVPDHAVVADGWLFDGTTESYHLNYGWGGNNNNWWVGGNSPLGGFQYGITGIRPRLTPFPLNDVVPAEVGKPAALQWMLPQFRFNEAAQINIKQLVTHTGTWTHAAEDFSETTSFGWTPFQGRSGSSWHSNEYSALLILDTEFVPSATSVFSFWGRFVVFTRPFHVKISTDGGQTWTIIHTVASVNNSNWQQVNLPLGAYEGETVRIKFLHGDIGTGGYYLGTGVGVRMDDFSFTDGVWRRWENYAVDSNPAAQSLQTTTITAPAAAGNYRFAATVTDMNNVEHFVGPGFTLAVASGALPPDALKITGFNSLGNGQFSISWDAHPALQGLPIEIIGSMMLPAINGWHAETPLTINANSAVFAPLSNRFFRVKAD